MRLAFAFAVLFSLSASAEQALKTDDEKSLYAIGFLWAAGTSPRSR